LQFSLAVPPVISIVTVTASGRVELVVSCIVTDSPSVTEAAGTAKLNTASEHNNIIIVA